MRPRPTLTATTPRQRALQPGWRRRDVQVSVILALAGVELVYLSNFVQKVPWQADVGWVALGAVALAAPLAWRRRFPTAVMVAVSFLYFVLGTWVGVEMYASQVVLFLGFYSVGAWCPDRRRATWSRAVLSVGMATWLLWSTVDRFTDPEVGEHGVNAYMAFALIQLLVNIAYFTGAWIFGNRTWRAAIEREELEAAHAEIREQQDRLAEQAVSLERLRIARELHDVVAHHVTAMGVQAGAARLSMARDPEAAATHLRGVESSAREAVAELRTMVHTLRDGEPAPDSLPRLADLDVLVAEARSLGQHAVLERVGPQPQLPPPAELALYRTAQEAVTNVRKHAGPRAALTVRLRTEPARVELEISDDGRGGPSRGVVPEGTGLGITGMRERVTAVGGTLEAGPKPDGGWLVRATVPTTGDQTAEPSCRDRPANPARAEQVAVPAHHEQKETP